MVEVVGWEENPQSKRTAQSVKGIGNVDNVIFIPKPFPHLASELLRRFKTKIMKRVPDRRLGFKERDISSDRDYPLEWSRLNKQLSDTFNILLSMALSSC